MSRTISVIGLGYVGLPVAAAFAAKGFRVIGFDVSKSRIEELRAGHDKTGEVESAALKPDNLAFTDNAEDIRDADFFIITVPTPINDANQPDLRALLAASTTVGKVLKKGDIVVYESTVYPGATEEDCLPVLESVSGLKAGADFKVGYSPERINPGDKEHRFETILKVVSGMDEEALEAIAGVYGAVVKAGIHKAPTIKAAEAAKVIENTQRDINIALMNELSLICQELGVDTLDVLAAAETKWNFLPFKPGLVGGHCIGVDPYYLTHRAERAGYHPEVILSGRRINNSMARWLSRKLVQKIVNRHGNGRIRVGILGFTFKQNVPDVRNTKIVDMVRELESYGIDVRVHDPVADRRDAEEEYGVSLSPLEDLRGSDAIVLAVPHDAFVEGGWGLVSGLLPDGKGLVLDLKGVLERKTIPGGIDLWRL